jgi:hypothetical protein
VVQGERKVNEELIPDGLRDVMLLDNIVDMLRHKCQGFSNGYIECGRNTYGHSRADKERKDKCDNVVMARPEVHVDSVEYPEKRETPRDTVNDDAFTGREELVNDCS